MLSPEVIALLLLDTLFVLFGFFAFIVSLKIAWFWERDASSEAQFALEKKAVLVATIIKYIFYLKLPLFLFFIFTADTISGLITGAMCAAVVVNSVDFGLILFSLKITNLYLFGFWLILNAVDLNDEHLPYSRAKFALYCVAFFFLLGEVGYDFYFFTALNIDKIVSCCGTLFSAASTSSIAFMFELPHPLLFGTFYGFFALHGVLFYKKEALGFLVTNVLFVPVSILALILFFGTYIYELPTHHCPFCLLQKEYYYVGYLLYITLFGGTFFGFSAGVMSLIDTNNAYTSFYRYSFYLTTAFVLLVSAYPLLYFYRNGVWL